MNNSEFSKMIRRQTLIFESCYNILHNDLKISEFLSRTLLHLLQSPLLQHSFLFATPFAFERLYFYNLPIPILCAISSYSNKVKLYFVFGPFDNFHSLHSFLFPKPSLFSLTKYFYSVLAPFMINSGVGKIVLSGIGEGNILVQKLKQEFFSNCPKIKIEQISWVHLFCSHELVVQDVPFFPLHSGQLHFLRRGNPFNMDNCCCIPFLNFFKILQRPHFLFYRLEKSIDPLPKALSSHSGVPGWLRWLVID